MGLGTEVGLGPDDIVLDGDVAPPPQIGGAEPPSQFSAHVYCSQTAGWMKVALGMEVGLRPGHIVLDGDPAPLPKKGADPPIFGPFLLWPNGWMDEDATWYRSRPRPMPLCIRRVPRYPRKGHSSPPVFGPCLYCGHGRPSQLLLSSCSTF